MTRSVEYQNPAGRLLHRSVEPKVFTSAINFDVNWHCFLHARDENRICLWLACVNIRIRTPLISIFLLALVILLGIDPLCIRAFSHCTGTIASLQYKAECAICGKTMHLRMAKTHTDIFLMRNKESLIPIQSGQQLAHRIGERYLSPHHCLDNIRQVTWSTLGSSMI